MCVGEICDCHPELLWEEEQDIVGLASGCRRVDLRIPIKFKPHSIKVRNTWKATFPVLLNVHGVVEGADSQLEASIRSIHSI
jgi:hypothetical protein